MFQCHLTWSYQTCFFVFFVLHVKCSSFQTTQSPILKKTVTWLIYKGVSTFSLKEMILSLSQKIIFYLVEVIEDFWTRSGFHQNVQEYLWYHRFFSKIVFLIMLWVQNEYAISLSGWKSWQKRWWQCSSWIRTWITFALGSLTLKLSWPNPFTTVSAIEMRSKRDWLSNRSANVPFYQKLKHS